MLGKPIVPSMATVMIDGHTWSLMSSWSSSGEPSVTSELTRSGRSTASARPMLPPRLWPTISAGFPARSTACSSRRSSACTVDSMQPMFQVIPLRASS